jgi:hypothetical protein
MSTLSNSVWVSADNLIERMKESGDQAYDLEIEHLETAHAYFLGAMTVECVHNLELARQAAEALSGKPFHHELQEAIAALLSELHSSAHVQRRHVPKSDSLPERYGRAPRGLTDFFQGTDVHFGIFYPKQHVVAVFTSFESAQAGYRALSAAGFQPWEMIAVPGEEVRVFLEELREQRTVWDYLVSEISRILDTEVTLIDRYSHWARTGAGFLVAYSSTEEDAEAISRLLKPFDPMAMHWFMAGYIRHLL